MKAQITEDIPSIVVADLFSRGYPREEPAVMRCSVAGVIVEVVMAAHLDRVECTYWCDIDRYSPRDAQHIIPVSWTVPNYGGYRTWLHCAHPSCERRVGRLFFDGQCFLCRQCAGVRYASQVQATPTYLRQLEEAKAMRARLGGPRIVGAPIPARPKGMHHTTYGRLCSKVLELEKTAEEERAIAVLNVVHDHLERLERQVRTLASADGKSAPDT